LKTVSIFFLLIYWSIIIIAPVIDKNNIISNNKLSVLPIKKPLN